MSQTSVQAHIGSLAPGFNLPDMTGRRYQLSNLRGQIVLTTFWSAECPISKIYDPYFNEKLDDYNAASVQLLAIDSNSSYGDDEIRRVMQARNIRFPVLRDADNKVADAYEAETTPHIYLVDKEGILRYKGAIDDRTFRKRTPEMNYLENALEAMLAGRQPEPAETQPYGCTIVRT